MKNIIPSLLYGTAWKKQTTQQYVEQALQAGFRGIDTACQPKHYNEQGVGDGIQQFLATTQTGVTRQDLFIQTKFTPIGGQDPERIPYDASASLSTQVKQSIQISLQNLHTDYLDSLLLHSPLQRVEDTMEVWRAMETAVDQGLVRYLGISNIYQLEQLQTIVDRARIKPSFVQNRFYAKTNYDVAIRRFCEAQQQPMIYQSFWTLTANPHLLKHPVVVEIARQHACTPQQVFFAFIHSQNIVFLTGTTTQSHMEMDLTATALELTREEVDSINQLLELAVE